jgi:hypothetical protein
VVSLRTRVLVLAPIRAALSAVELAAAALTGEPSGTAFLGWAVGAGLMAIILAGDPGGRHAGPPEPLPERAEVERWTETARRDVFPSTVAVGLFGLGALPFDPTVTAMMAGILGGMAIMTVVGGVQVRRLERRHGGYLYRKRGGRRRLFVGMAQRDEPNRGTSPR